MSLVVVKIA